MNKELSNFYIFTGTEYLVQKIYLEEMSKVYGMPITYADSVISVYGKCTSKSLFGSTVGFYVIREDTEVQKQESFYETLPHDIGENVIVLIYENLDSRLKFGKHFSDCTVEFGNLSDLVIDKYIKREVKLSNENVKKLSNEISGSFDLLKLETDKIKQYSQSQMISEDEGFKRLYSDGIIIRNEESSVFDFTDSVCGRKVISFEIAELLRNQGNSSINILGTLYNSMKNVLLIQVCENSDVAGTTGLDNRQIYFNKKYVGRYDDWELVRAVRLIASVVDDIKNGRMEDEVAVKYVLVSIL
jgi:DNA polymerase III delta subunit